MYTAIYIANKQEFGAITHAEFSVHDNQKYDYKVIFNNMYSPIEFNWYSEPAA